METVKEKLYALLNEAGEYALRECRLHTDCNNCKHNGEFCDSIVSYLIQNGVTIQECGMDCKSCWKTKIVNPVQEWVSVDERLPEESEYLRIGFDARKFYIRFEIAYKTDTIEYAIGYYDGFKWFDERNRFIKNVVGWRILETFPEPPKGGSDES